MRCAASLKTCRKRKARGRAGSFRPLTPEERARLVGMLLDALGDLSLAEIEAGLEIAAAEEAAAYARGELEPVSVEEIFAEAERLAGKP